MDTTAGTRQLPTDSVAANIDWITSTGGASGPTAGLGIYGRHLVSREAHLGNPRLPWAFCGYVGEQSGRARWGERRDGCIAIAQSGLASEVWEHLADLARNISRVDLAVDWFPGREVKNVGREHWAEAEQTNRREGRQIRRQLIIDGQGGQTFYLGSRSSDWFGRCYDKWRQSGSDAYKHAWRYELEIKGDHPMAVLGSLRSATNRTDDITATVHNWFTKRGIRPKFQAAGNPLRDGAEPSKTGDVAKLDWIASAVGPSARYLAEKYGWHAVLQALDIPSEILHHVTRSGKHPLDERR